MIVSRSQKSCDVLEDRVTFFGEKRSYDVFPDTLTDPKCLSATPKFVCVQTTKISQKIKLPLNLENCTNQFTTELEISSAINYSQLSPYGHLAITDIPLLRKQYESSYQ